MVILSSSEFRSMENDRIQKGIQGLTQQINIQSARGFGHETASNTVTTSLNNNEYIGYLLINDRVAASGFGRLDSKDGSDIKHKTMYIHSISVSAEFRGQGLCQKITGEFIKKFGNHILYLTVRTELGNENISGIRCYEKSGFVLLNEVYRDHYDGKNNAMIRLPTMNKRANTRKRRSRKKGKK
jgi:ribosomal protein S18 acetylase RimI-like enzyme